MWRTQQKSTHLSLTNHDCLEQEKHLRHQFFIFSPVRCSVPRPTNPTQSRPFTAPRCYIHLRILLVCLQEPGVEVRLVQLTVAQVLHHCHHPLAPPCAQHLEEEKHCYHHPFLVANYVHSDHAYICLQHLKKVPYTGCAYILTRLYCGLVPDQDDNILGNQM